MRKRTGRKVNKAGRSEGEARFVQIPYWLLEAPAARSLSSTAFKVLVYVLKRFNGVNNGLIAFGTRSGCFLKNPTSRQVIDVSIGMKQQTVSDALFELQGAGFIACARESVWTGTRGTKGQGIVREWRLTWLSCNGEAPTKDFINRSGNFRRVKNRLPKLDYPTATAVYRPSNSPPGRYDNSIEDPQNGLNRPPGRSNGERNSPPGRYHLITIPRANGEPKQ